MHEVRAAPFGPPTQDPGKTSRLSSPSVRLFPARRCTGKLFFSLYFPLPSVLPRFASPSEALVPGRPCLRGPLPLITMIRPARATR